MRLAVSSGALLFGGIQLSLQAQTAPVPPSDTAGSTRAAPATAQEKPIQLSPFEVTDSNDKGYGSTNSVGGSRINTPLMEVSNYTTVLNEALLKDRGANDLMDVLTLASGVSYDAQSNQGFSNYTLRGYEATGATTRDGIPDRQYSTDGEAVDTSTLERVEIIKGPAGVLYGSNGMGGIVNRVGKMPKSQALTTLQVQGSSGWANYLRGMLDSTGPIDSSGRAAYRVVASYRSGENSWGGIENRLATMGTLRYIFPGEHQVKVWSRFYYSRTNINRDQGVLFVDKNGNMPDFLLGRNRASTSSFPLDANSIQISRNYEAGTEMNFDALGGSWTARFIGRYMYADGDRGISYASGAVNAYSSTGALLGTNATLAWDDARIADWRTTLTLRSFEGYYEQAVVNADLIGHYIIGPTDQTLIINVGSQYDSTQRTFLFWSTLFPKAPTFAPNSYSLLRAQADLAGFNFNTIPAGRAPSFNPNSNRSKAHNPHYGIQDNISIWNKKLIGVVGVRLDEVSDTAYTLNSSLEPTKAVNFESSNWIYKYGLVAMPMDGLSLFANYSTTYQPVFTNNAAGVKYPDQQGKIKEIGVKSDLLHGRLVATASVFDMSLTNVLVSVLNPPELGGGTVQVPQGVQKTKGWEADISYQVMAGLNALVAYSNLTSVNATGVVFRNVPQTPTYAATVSYTLQHGTLKGVGFGGTYQHLGKRAGDAANTFTIAPTNFGDAFVSYTPNRIWDVRLNITNVTNGDAVMSAVSNVVVSPQRPRTYRLTFTYNFR